ncbi:CD9 antigen isoform X1 [Synchiropus splendidus]|uniref:CD9 antigen isoform X1 n=1 Tax=Synchiropus splendidus TaxID=270530 RepID=UPI00237DE982|nr:CD9 antigen isoform X1 [Synchiropus splendidus]
MAVGGCGVVCKYIIIIFNIVLAGLGLAFLGFGLWLRFGENTRPIFQIEELNSSVFVTAVTLLIIVGSVMLLLIAFGYHGACNERRCSLIVYSVLLSILVATVVLVGFLSYTRRDKVGKYLSQFYSELYTLYVATSDPAIGVVLTFIQEIVHCCGMTGITLVELVKMTCPRPDSFFDHFMPRCPRVIANLFDQKASLVMGIFVVTGGLLVTAVICSMVLSSKILRSYSAPQYIILTPTISTVPSPQGQVYTANPDRDPVVFTPLTDANVPLPVP